MKTKQAYILAGGRGERLRPLTDELPKPLIVIRGKPILEWNIECLAKNGVKNVVIGIGYLGEKIKEYFGKGENFGLEIEYVKENCPLGTGGALKHARDFLDKRFFMINGDNLADFKYKEIDETHTKKNAKATIALYEVEDVSSYGVAKIEGDKIVDFIEKPKKEEAPSKLINAGAYVIEKDCIEIMPNGFCLIEKELFPILANQGNLYYYIHKGQWYPTDTIERLKKAQEEWKGF